MPPVHTYQHAGLRVQIVYDERTGSPREMDNLVSIQIGVATITPGGETTLTLTHGAHVPQQTHAA